jgi:desulfoferrodoxin (superoxide reductase-like protein)
LGQFTETEHKTAHTINWITIYIQTKNIAASRFAPFEDLDAEMEIILTGEG